MFGGIPEAQWRAQARAQARAHAQAEQRIYGGARQGAITGALGRIAELEATPGPIMLQGPDLPTFDTDIRHNVATIRDDMPIRDALQRVVDGWLA